MNVSPDVMDVLKVLLKLRDLDGLGDVALLDLAQDARLEKPGNAPPLSTLPAFRRLHLDEVDPVKLIEETRQEINEIVSLLAA